jgi:O-antigen/teichoic acid export membrane protein
MELSGEKAPQTGSVKKNTYFMTISQFGNLALALVLRWAAARYLGVEDYGRYGIASVMAFFVFIFNDLGVAVYLTREVAKQKDRVESYFINGIVLKLILIGLVVVFLGSYLKLFSYPREKMIAVVLFGIYGVLFSFNQHCGAVYRAFERMEYEMYITLLEKFVTAALGVTVLLLGYGLVTFCAVFVFSGALSLTVNLTLVKKKFLKKPAVVDWSFSKHLLRAAFFLGIFWFITTIHERVDVVMLEAIKEDIVVGWYTLAYGVILAVGVIPMILMTSTFPRISKESGVNDEQVQNIFQIGFKYLFYVAVPMVVGTLFLADKIVLFFEEGFADAAPALRILICAAGADFFSVFFAGFLMAWNRQRDLTLLQAGALILNVVVNLILIPRYGHVGAAAATLLSRGVIFVVCFTWVFKRLRLTELHPLGLCLISTAVMAAFLTFVKVGLFFSIGLSVLIFGGVLYLMGGIRMEEVMVIRRGETGRP